MRYVDGFLLPVPKKNMASYRRMAKLASKIWLSHGALQYMECSGDDMKPAFGLPFPGVAKARAGETVVFAWIVYKSKAHRAQVNKKVMKDPRMNEMMNGKPMPFDPKRMAYGGFKALVDA